MQTSTGSSRSSARNISRKTKAMLSKTLVLSMLLYGCGTWKMTKGEEKKLNIFQTQCLRRNFRIRWQQHVPNKEVLEMAGTDPISEEVSRKRWYWIGHVLRKEVNNDCAVALGWKPEGKRSRGRPNTTWRRTVEKERDRQGWNTWTRARQAANNRQQWREDVWALCASWHE